jgi:Tfp pilus assembly protein PilX
MEEVMTRSMRRALRDRRAVLRGDPADSDSGIALIMVLLILMAVSGILVGLLSMSLGGMAQARARQDSPASLQAAQAGIDDFLIRLNQSPTNYVPDPTTNPALTGWVPVSGATNGAKYRYWVDNAVQATSGRVTVISSGMVNKKVRTVRASLKINSFADYLYFTNYEVRDPALPGGSSSCAVYGWQTARSAGCNIYFRGAGGVTDQLDGKVFSNDIIATAGSPVFGDTVETGAPSGSVPPAYNRDTSTAGFPVFNNAAGGTTNAPYQALPAGNSQLQTDATTSFGGKTGCVYYGSTKIRFVPAVPGTPGHMMVTSPNTTAAESPAGRGCGTWPVSLPGSQAEQWVPLPGNGIVYVADMPSGTGTCLTEFQTTRSTTPTWLPGDIDTYACRNGDAWVHGTNSGQVTVGAQNDIYLTNNLLNTGGTSITGLIANNFIWLWHPVNSGGVNNLQETTVEDGVSVISPPSSIEVDALMLSDTDSIVAQNYDKGPQLGTFKVVGGLIQNFRGTVGTSGSATTGYTKLYTYDDRLRGLIPPHFSQPGTITWGRDTTAEESPRTG